MSDELISKQKLKEFGKDYVKILIRELKRLGKNSSGRLIKSIDYRIKEDAKEINIEILSADYLKFIDEGRKKGSYPPIKPLIAWTKIQGINEEAAYAIQKSIFKFGIKPTRVIQTVIKEYETSTTLKKKYEDEVVNQIIKNINLNYKQK